MWWYCSESRTESAAADVTSKTKTCITWWKLTKWQNGFFGGTFQLKGLERVVICIFFLGQRSTFTFAKVIPWHTENRIPRSNSRHLLKLQHFLIQNNQNWLSDFDFNIQVTGTSCTFAHTPFCIMLLIHPSALCCVFCKNGAVCSSMSSIWSLTRLHCYLVAK